MAGFAAVFILLLLGGSLMLAFWILILDWRKAAAELKYWKSRK